MKALIFVVLCSLSYQNSKDKWYKQKTSPNSWNQNSRWIGLWKTRLTWLSTVDDFRLLTTPLPYTVPTLSGELRYQSMHSLFDQITDVSIHMRSFFFIFCYRQCREECRDYVTESDISTIVFAYFCHGWNGVFCRIHIFSTSGIFGVDDLEKQWDYIW